MQSAGEREREDSPRAMEGEHYSCHTERSEVSKSKNVDLQNHLDSSVAPLPQNDNDRNNIKKSPPFAEGFWGWVAIVR